MKHITKEEIDLNKLMKEARHPKAGAIVLFDGEVRNHNLGKGVQFLEYECHEKIADQLIAEILEEAGNTWELHNVICQHRVGKVGISESAVVVITSASHRRVAYEANQYIIERVKFDVPIWKKEYFSDGHAEWGSNTDYYTQKSKKND